MFRKILDALQQFSTPQEPPEKDGSQPTVVQDSWAGEKGIKSHTTPQFSVGQGQSIGRQRNHNEDASFSLTSKLAHNDSELPLGLYIVADGMGGHQNGEIASELAIRSVVTHIFQEIISPLLSLNPQPREASFQEVFQASIEKANAEIVSNSFGGGTTVTAVLIVGEQMTIAHVGDSRVYAVEESGEMDPLTRDHSLVKRLQELGQITSEEAAVHPQRNVLYRALGQGEPFDPEIISMHRPEEGYLLICSDGLWSIVNEDAISNIILNNPDPQRAVDRLIDAANEAGGPDNISVILVKLPDTRP